MAEQLNLNSDDQNKLSELAISALQEGKIIIAPLEHAYVFVADAFNHGAVKKIHAIRGDDRGVAAQVIVGDIKTATGITREFGATTISICEKFWPGLLTLRISPAEGLEPFWRKDLRSGVTVDLVPDLLLLFGAGASTRRFLASGDS